jgi:hypothetical protein
VWEPPFFFSNLLTSQLFVHLAVTVCYQKAVFFQHIAKDPRSLLVVSHF